MIQGFDSRWWNGILPAGYDYRFYIAKLNEGEWTSPQFPIQYRAANQLGLLRSAFNFHRYASDAVKSAKAYHDGIIANGGYGKIPPVLDCEDTRAPRGLKLVEHMWTELQEMEQLAGQEVMVYSAKWWWDYWAKPYVKSQHDFYSRPLWEADPAPDTPEPGEWTKEELAMVQVRLGWNAPGFNAAIDVDEISDEQYTKWVGDEPETFKAELDIPKGAEVIEITLRRT